MEFTITGLDDMRTRLNATAKSIAYGVSKGINDTLFGLRTEIQKEIKDAFDRPVPIVVNSVRYEKSVPETLTGRVFIAGSRSNDVNVARILRPHIFGSDRVVKASERRLRRFGFMGQDQYIVPGPGVALDQYGNIPGPTMVKILSQIQAFSEAGFGANAKLRGMTWKRYKQFGSVYFVQRVGVFARQNSGASIPLLFFTKNKPKYEAERFYFYATADYYVQENLNSHLLKALTYAIATAR